MSREKALKRINEYLAKQQPQKVELGIIDDYDKWRKRASNMKNEAFDLLQKTETAFKSAVNLFETAQSVAEEGVKGAKKLGIDETPFTKRVNDAKENVKKFSKYINLK
jgi:conjugal transfer/entry exclusion protein